MRDTDHSVEEKISEDRDPQVCRVWPEITTAQDYNGKQSRGEDTEETSRQVDKSNLARDVYCPRTSTKRG